MTTPIIVDSWNNREYLFDLYSRLLRDRIIMLDTVIDDFTATNIVTQILFLEDINPQKPITIYINSPGGLISAGLAIYDTMQYVSCPIITCCMGQAASMAAVLLASGSPGCRCSLKHSRIMIHQPKGGYVGQATDIEIHAHEINRLKDILTDILVYHTGTNKEVLVPLLDRDTFLSPSEAIELGMIDGVIQNKQKYGL